MAAKKVSAHIFGRAEECNALFSDCLELLSERNNTPHWTSLLDQLGRFRIWCSNIGVFAELHASLDYRLRDVSYIRDLIVQLLASIRDCLGQSEYL